MSDVSVIAKMDINVECKGQPLRCAVVLLQQLHFHEYIIKQMNISTGS